MGEQKQGSLRMIEFSQFRDVVGMKRLHLNNWHLVIEEIGARSV